MATIIRDGTSQDERMPAALCRDYVRPDEMSLPEILFLGSRFSSLLAYFDASDHAAGDWQRLFASDASALLATILTETSRLDHWRQEFRGFLLQMQAFSLKLGACPSPESVPLYHLDKLIRGWRESCGRCPEQTAARLGQLIDGLLRAHLTPALEALGDYLSRHDARHSKYLPRTAPRAEPRRIPLPPPEAAYREVLPFLNDIFLSYSNALAVIRKLAAEQFPLSLPTGKHEPAIGLYLAFAELFLKSKGRIDDFSQRQLRFYYDQILRFRPQPARADSTYLVLKPDGAVAESVVRQGTPFIAWEAHDGSELLYDAEDDLLVTDARIAVLHTLYFDRDPLRSPEKDLGYATSARQASIPTGPGKQHYALFGGRKRRSETPPGSHARFGFAIASPVLLLREGSRNIRIDLHFHAAPESIDKLVEKLCAIIPTASPEGAFFKVFAGIFRIRLTTENGWTEPAAFIPACHLVDSAVANDCLRIEIKLPEDFPPVVAYDAKVHGESYSTDSPLIDFAIASDTYLYAYDFLSRLALREIKLTVNVRGCRELSLYNNHGELSAATPFTPFGPLPQAGANFIVGSREAFAKQLSALELRVTWDGLPPGGLAEHYQSYPGKLGPASFQITLGALNDRVWQPEKAAERIVLPLFGDDQKSTRYDCTRLLPYLRATSQDDGNAYGPQARGGYVRLTLSDPPGAFAHAAYPKLLAEAMTRNAQLESLGPLRRRLDNKRRQLLPEPPYTPRISSISLDYTAQARISPHQAKQDAASGCFHHLHPFGQETLSLGSHGETRLIPASPQDANLFIGIAASQLGGPLSLYFHLRNDSEMDMDMAPPQFTWSYLNANNWQVLEEFRILSDTTRGFLVSGIVRLELPSGMPRGASVMPGDLYWLRLSASGPAQALCSIYAVHTHGLRVRRIIGDLPLGPDVLPAGSIKKARSALPGIGEIDQPGDSFGGQARESIEAMTVRASERLRHRQRAVTPWDYEHLVLQRFPHLHKVKCFANTRFTRQAAGWHQPGSLLVVVVPRLQDARDSSERFKENVLVLREIKDFLEGLASPFARIDVRNPVFERIQVRCAAKFKGLGNGGLLIKQLNRDICGFISPWEMIGNSANFGWSLHAQEIQGYLQSLPYIESIWGLSLLRVVDNGNDAHVLNDTAQAQSTGLGEVTPTYPWSLAIPFRHHLIESASTLASNPDGPWPTGISRLQVGTTFIVSGTQNGEKK
jgi:hypothetical protein